jgi:hypothetical protein
MNYALLRKYSYKGDSQELEAIYFQVVSTWMAQKAAGCNELVFYLSDTEPKVFFSLGLWATLEQLEHAYKYTTPLLNYNGIDLLEQYIFELMQEYRRLDLKIEASFIRLVTYPEPVIIEQFIKSTLEARMENRTMPGFIGGWSGRCLSNHSLILSRVDWASHEAMQAFLSTKPARGLTKWYLAEGAQIEYASYHLQAVIPFKPIL